MDDLWSWEIDKCSVTATAKNWYDDKNHGECIKGLGGKKKSKKEKKKELVFKIWLFLKCLPSNSPTNAPSMAVFHILTAIPHRVSTQASPEIHPGDLSCPALVLGHLPAPTLPKPWPIAAPAGHGRAQSASVSAVLRCNNLFPTFCRLAPWKETTRCANFPVCAPVAAGGAHLCPLSSAWPHFPHTLSELAHGEVKVGSSSYVQSPGKISSPQSSVYFSHCLTHGFGIMALLFTADSKIWV